MNNLFSSLKHLYLDHNLLQGSIDTKSERDAKTHMLATGLKVSLIDSSSNNISLE